MTRNILILAMFAVGTIGLTACGGGDDDDTVTTDETDGGGGEDTDTDAS